MGDTNLLDIIRKKYGSLDRPDYSFVHKAVSSRPYDSLLKQFESSFEIEEITDTNSDVSFRYLISRSGKQWVIELSMVDLYAIVLRISEVGLSELVILENLELQEEVIYALLVDYGFKFLGHEELAKPIAFNLCNTDSDSTCFYQALFSDTDTLPWVVHR